MNKETLIRKMEEGVAALREQLANNDGSALSALASNAKAGYAALKVAVMGNEKARHALDSLKEHLDSLEKAVVAGDKKMSAKAVEVLEKALNDLKEKKDDGEPKA